MTVACPACTAVTGGRSPARVLVGYTGLKTGYLRKKKVSSWKAVGWKKR